VVDDDQIPAPRVTRHDPRQHELRLVYRIRPGCPIGRVAPGDTFAASRRGDDGERRGRGRDAKRPQQATPVRLPPAHSATVTGRPRKRKGVSACRGRYVYADSSSSVGRTTNCGSSASCSQPRRSATDPQSPVSSAHLETRARTSRRPISVRARSRPFARTRHRDPSGSCSPPTTVATHRGMSPVLTPRNKRKQGFSDGRYWARTSDPQLVELVLSQLS
jgi:hypothetical protein